MSEANSGPGRVTREQHGHLFLIGLDRAGKRNAFDSAMLADLALAMGEYERSEESRCAVLFAHGEHFTAGLDLMELAPKLAASGFRYPDGGVDPWGVVQPRRSKPLVVAVQGTSNTPSGSPGPRRWRCAPRCNRRSRGATRGTMRRCRGSTSRWPR